MEPIPETVRAVEDYGPFIEGDLIKQLKAQAERVKAVVPDCVGLSLARIEDSVTFTLVATSQEIAAFDGLQYVGGGPCVAAVEQSQVIEYQTEDPLDEQSWQLFAQGCGAAGVMSTLSLPIPAGDVVVGSVNLYAATPDAFTGHHEEVAAIFDAWAPGAITNADLSFTTRATAQGAPQQLGEDVSLQIAVGILSVEEDISLDVAHEQLLAAAQRAGIGRAQLAAEIVRSNIDRHKHY